MNPTERASHPSRAQVSHLDSPEKNPSLAKGVFKTPSAPDASRNPLEVMTAQLNKGYRNWELWIKNRAANRSAEMKKAALRCNASNKTDDGLRAAIELFDLEKKNRAANNSAEMKKAAIRYNASNETDDGLREAIELFDLEKKILALTGGKSSSTVDRHQEKNPFKKPAIPVTQDSLSLQADLRNIHPPLPIVTQEIVNAPHRTPPTAATPIALQPPTPSRSGNFPALTDSNTPTTGPSRSQRRRARSLRSQRQLISITERVLALEERRLEVDRHNSQVMAAFVRRQEQRDHVATKALQAIGEGINLITDLLEHK